MTWREGKASGITRPTIRVVKKGRACGERSCVEESTPVTFDEVPRGVAVLYERSETVDCCSATDTCGETEHWVRGHLTGNASPVDIHALRYGDTGRDRCQGELQARVLVAREGGPRTKPQDVVGAPYTSNRNGREGPSVSRDNSDETRRYDRG